MGDLRPLTGTVGSKTGTSRLLGTAIGIIHLGSCLGPRSALGFRLLGPLSLAPPCPRPRARPPRHHRRCGLGFPPSFPLSSGVGYRSIVRLIHGENVVLGLIDIQASSALIGSTC